MLKLQKLEKEKLHQQINKKWVRVITVIIYIISVSLVAIILGLYYRFWWKAEYANVDGHINEMETYKIATFKIPRRLSNKSSVNVTEYLDELFRKLTKEFKIKSHNIQPISKQLLDDTNEESYEFVLSLMSHAKKQVSTSVNNAT